jgi:hypothetical protein
LQLNKTDPVAARNGYASKRDKDGGLRSDPFRIFQFHRGFLSLFQETSMIRRASALSSASAFLAISASFAFAQTSNPAPVAYAYVSTPVAIEGFAVAANGRLTPVPGSPYAGIAVTHMSIAKGYLFGSGDDANTVYSFAIKSDGSLALNDVVTAGVYDQCSKMTSTQVDRTGSTLYLLESGCSGKTDLNIQAYQISSKGTLQFIGNIAQGGTGLPPGPSQLYFTGNNEYAYQLQCLNPPPLDDVIWGWKRESTGYLDALSVLLNGSLEETIDDCYITTDDFGHVAVAMKRYDYENGSYVYDGYAKVDSMTVEANGTLSSTHGFDVRAINLANGNVNAMSISPAGNLLVVGGMGFQIYHFNGGNPIEYYSSALQTKNQFEEFGWDKSNHLFALSTDGVRVYNITTASYSEAPGSPLEIAGGAKSLIVLALQ